MQTPETERAFLLFGLPPYRRSQKGLWLLVGYYLFSILFGAVMAAPSYWFVVQMNTLFPSELGVYLLDHTLDDYFERMRMVPLLLGLPWIMWMCRLLSFRALGIAFSWAHVRSACYWACLGFGLLALVAAGQVYFGAAVLRDDAPSLWVKLPSAIAGCLIIAFLEEIVFRGIVLRIFYTACGALGGVVFSSAFYAYTHFKVPNQLLDVVAGDTDFLSGLRVGFWTLCGIGYSATTDPLDFALTFLTLFGLGTAIGQVFLKTRTLLPGIGLHAGIVFLMLMYQGYFHTVNSTFLWGHAGFRNGFAALVVVAVMNLAIYYGFARGARGVAGMKS